MSNNFFISESPKVFINGRTLDWLNLCVKGRPDIPSPKPKLTTNEQQHSPRGNLTNRTGWDDITIDVVFNYLEDFQDVFKSFRKAFPQMRKTFFEAKTLSFNDDTESYFVVKSVSLGDASNEFMEYGEFTVSFLCEPFAYLKESEGGMIIPFKYISAGNGQNVSETVITNDGFYPSYPIITIYRANSTGSAMYKLELYEVDSRGVKSSKPYWQVLTNYIPDDNDLIIDADKTLVYFKNVKTGTVTDVPLTVELKTFPYLPEGESILVVNGGWTNAFNCEIGIERKRVI